LNRKQLESQFRSPDTSPWKTFVLETHADGDDAAFLADVFGSGASRETDDRSLHQLFSSDLSITVDHLDPRFWSFHTRSSTAATYAFLKSAVARRRDLDFVWLPSAHLRRVQRDTPPNWIKTNFTGRRILPADEVQELSVMVRGRASQSLLDLISRQRDHAHAISLSQVVESVNRTALFVAKGESFTLHELVVQQVVSRYRRLVEAAESLALGFERVGDEGGGHMLGGPIELRFSRALPDLERFLDDLLSSREPFRLWGMVDNASDDYAEIEAVDLHVGQRIRIEVSREMLRVHLRAGGCGNTIARLVANLQHHVDGGIRAVDDRMNSELSLASVVAA
jgi:hypothetical protein